jgi:hypothetical protein
MIVVLAEGEISWDDSTHDFDWSKTNALPLSAKGAFREEPA